nr:ribonuclease H-like domain-containing protein [Tanacetum cinerariifolium]
MTDLGALNYFLSISATRHSTGLFLSRKQYAIELLACAHMTNCNPSRTPVHTDSKLGPEGVPTISRSRAEAEYRGVANVVAETAWIRNLLRELHSPLSVPNESSRLVPKDPSRSVLEEPTRSVPKDPSRSVPKEPTRSVPKEPSRSVPEEPTRSVPKESSRSVPEEPTRSVLKESTRSVHLS